MIRFYFSKLFDDFNLLVLKEALITFFSSPTASGAFADCLLSFLFCRAMHQRHLCVLTYILMLTLESQSPLR